jgi:alkyl hydroperoxide reductase subunit AhpF
MLRAIQEIIEKDDKYKVRLKCGHMLSHKFKIKPSFDSVYNCPACEIKGQGTKASGVGYLNNGLRRKGHD